MHRSYYVEGTEIHFVWPWPQGIGYRSKSGYLRWCTIDFCSNISFVLFNKFQSMYEYSKKKSSQKKSILPTYPNFFQGVTWTTHNFFIWPYGQDQRSLHYQLHKAGILSYQGLRFATLTLGLTMILSSDWVRHKTKIVIINMINHKAVQKIDKHQASR